MNRDLRCPHCMNRFGWLIWVIGQSISFEMLLAREISNLGDFIANALKRFEGACSFGQVLRGGNLLRADDSLERKCYFMACVS